MRLHVGEGAAEQFCHALDRQPLDHVDELAAAIVALAGQALRVLVGQYRALGFEHGAADDVFRGNQLDLVALARELAADRIGHFRIRPVERNGEKIGARAVGGGGDRHGGIPFAGLRRGHKRCPLVVVNSFADALQAIAYRLPSAKDWQRRPAKPQYLAIRGPASRVARMKRSEIRERLFPHSAALHAGYNRSVEEQCVWMSTGEQRLSTRSWTPIRRTMRSLTASSLARGRCGTSAAGASCSPRSSATRSGSGSRAWAPRCWCIRRAMPTA